MLVAAGILVAKLNRHCHFFQSLTKKKLFLITTHERAWQLNSPTSLGNCRPYLMSSQENSTLTLL